MFRLRSESVSIDSTGDDAANALTLKTRMNFKTAPYKGVGAFVEMDDVTSLTSVDYKTAPNDSSQDGPAIADPEGTEVNQAFLTYSNIPSTTVKWGRQRITLDDHRHVGHVAWRQNEQTYDAFSVENKSIKDVSIFASKISTVNRVFGELNPIGSHDVDTVLLNVSYAGLPFGKFTAYYYDMDYVAAGLAGRSSTTVGARFSGATKTSETLKVLYTAEFAKQSDAHDNPGSYDANYYHLEGGVVWSGFTVKLGQELLGADGSDGFFQSNLATLHKFQGWTDMFLNLGRGNIQGGIEDTYFSVGTKVSGVKLLGVYHTFGADDEAAAGKSDYGSEIGFLAAKQFGQYGLALKYADYSADDHGVDTQKIWLTASAKF
jgi:hypothetical protein